MGAFEEELYEDIAMDEAEGAALMEDELEDLGMDDFEDEDEFEDEFDEGFEMEAYDEDDAFEYDAMDEFDMGDEFGDGFEAYEEGYEDAEEVLEDAMVYALGAEDADEFLTRLGRRFRRVAKVVKRGAPVVGKIAYAQVIGRIAGLVGQMTKLVQRLRAEGASEEEALDAFAEMAARDPRALPIVAGLTARTILKSKGARMSPTARKTVVKQMKGAAKTLVVKRGPAAIRAMPKIAKSVKRTAAAKGASPVTATKAVRRTAAKVARSLALTRKLARPSPIARRRVAKVARVGAVRPRSYVIPGPARITISAA